MIESTILDRLARLLDDVDSRLVVDRSERLTFEADEMLFVSFHLEGAWASPASFSFPFLSSVPLDESFSALRDMIERNYAAASMPPPVYREGAAHRSAGAD